VVASEALARGPARSELASALVVPYAPQPAILARAAAFVTHGGAGSVTESLDAGVPLVIVPLSGDQGIQARLVRASGAGLAVERRDLTPASARASLTALLAPDSPERARARQIEDAWRDLDGAARAARAIRERSAEVA
jgi:zeaxanthin glucosyltransferase